MIANEKGRDTGDVAARETVQLGGLNFPDNNHIRSLQAMRIQRRFFLSLPAALAVASLAYGEAR